MDGSTWRQSALGGLEQFADLLARRAEGRSGPKRFAVEPLHLALAARRQSRRCPSPPTSWPTRCGKASGRRRIAPAGRERMLWQQSDVLGEHREQAAHEEHRHVFRVVTACRLVQRLSRSWRLRQPLGDGARRLGGDLGRVELLRVGPDRAKRVRESGVAEVFEVDAEALAVGELGVVFSLAAKNRRRSRSNGRRRRR